MKKILATISLIGILIFSSVFFTFPQQTQAATTPLTCTVITYDLWPNSKDSRTQGQVTKLQNFLIAGGYLNASPTGNIGPLTEAALQVFQKAQGIVSSGNYVSTGYGATGPKTRVAIKNVSCNGGTGVRTSVSLLPLGCNPGYKFSTLTGQPCFVSSTTTVATTISGGRTISSGGTSGNSGNNSGNTNTQTQTQTQNFPAGTILIPGSGFTGVTPQPGTVGSGPGSDAEAIARWDVVPNQTFSGNFNVGVVAFHMNGIDHVAFSVNGGPWTNIAQATLNPQTANTSNVGNPSSGVVEYWATLRASDFQDGKVEVRAIAYPTAGVPRVLNSLLLYTNNGQTQTYYISPTGNDSTGDGSAAHPWQTILAATLYGAPGSIVYMEPGSYSFAQRVVGFRDDKGKWQTFEPAPGVSRNQVTISTATNDSMRSGMTEFSNVRIDMTSGISFFGFNGLWLDNDEVFGNRAVTFTVSPVSADQVGNIYVTNSEFHDLSGGAIINGGQLIRNYKIYNNLIAHGLNDPGLAVNGVIDNLTTSDDPSVWGTPQEAHVDGVSWGMTNDGNSIVYGLTMTRLFDSLGLFSYYGFQNLAVVNVSISTTGNSSGGQNQFDQQAPNASAPYEHVYLDNVVLNDQALYFDDRGNGSSEWKNILVKDSKATAISAPFPIQLQNDTLINGTPIPNQSSSVQPTVSFSASPTTIASGSASMLTWSATNATSCSAGNGWSGPQAVSGSQSTGNLSTTTVFSLTCTGPGGSVNQSATVTVSATAPPSNQSSNANLVAEYQFDGNTNDSSSSGNNAVATGNPTYTTGHSGQAISFNGTNYVETNQNVSTTGSFTFSAWINGSDYSLPYNLYTFLSGKQQLTMMAIYNNALYMNVNGTNHFGSIPLSTGTWYNVVGVFDAGNQKVQLYVNGVLDKNEADTTGASISQIYRIGARGDRADAYTFNGSVDDVRIYNRVLSSTEVSQLYAGTLSLNTTKNTSPVAVPNTNNLANVLTSTLNLLPHAIPGTSYYNSLINTLSNALHALGIKK